FCVRSDYYGSSYSYYFDY
nr:immunoglobulin heavy chain junction region [Mus musculus]